VNFTVFLYVENSNFLLYTFFILPPTNHYFPRITEVLSQYHQVSTEIFWVFSRIFSFHSCIKSPLKAKNRAHIYLVLVTALGNVGTLVDELLFVKIRFQSGLHVHHYSKDLDISLISLSHSLSLSLSLWDRLSLCGPGWPWALGLQWSSHLSPGVFRTAGSWQFYSFPIISVTRLAALMSTSTSAISTASHWKLLKRHALFFSNWSYTQKWLKSKHLQLSPSLTSIVS
jgi:hypothetical protein